MPRKGKHIGLYLILACAFFIKPFPSTGAPNDTTEHNAQSELLTSIIHDLHATDRIVVRTGIRNVRKLEGQRSNAVISPLGSVLTNKNKRWDGHTRCLAADAIAQVGSVLNLDNQTRVLEILMPIAENEPNASVRACTVLALGTLGNTTAIPLLENAKAEDPDFRVRLAAENALIHILNSTLEENVLTTSSTPDGIQLTILSTNQSTGSESQSNIDPNEVYYLGFTRKEIVEYVNRWLIFMNISENDLP